MIFDTTMGVVVIVIVIYVYMLAHMRENLKFIPLQLADPGSSRRRDANWPKVGR